MPAPKISVVVPVYNVERYLSTCLDSLVGQSVRDFEVVMVDDGSTDGSVAIAEAFAERDPRFRLMSQPNGGLGKARNTGAASATGEFLAFVDSDDALPANAYELLLGALEETGSDFATGNVHRLSRLGTRQSPFLAKTFAQTRLKTHVRKFRPLLADRIVPNKLWRRSFWDRHALRFPEGVMHEDIPVVVPAQFLARSVDVISDPVYLYRIREGGDLSITQRRVERRALLDRLAAIEHVSGFLAEHGPRRAKRWYDESVVADDLRYYLNVLDGADDEYRALFLDRVNPFLERAGDQVFAALPAIDRLKWHLVRRRAMPELLEVLRFQREDLGETPPVRVDGHWYGDYPFRTDRELAIPESVYRVDGELGFAAHVDDLRMQDGKLRMSGWAFVRGIGAPEPGVQRVTVTALRPGPLRRVRLRLPLGPIHFTTTPQHRPDVTATADHQLRDVAWSGFVAELDPRRLRTAGRWREGRWELYVTVRVDQVRRRRSRFTIGGARPLRAIDLPAPAGVAALAAPGRGAGIALTVHQHWAALRDHRLDGSALELSGELLGGAGAELRLEAALPDGSARRRFGVELGADGGPRPFTARLPLKKLLRGGARPDPQAEDDEDPEIEDAEPGDEGEPDADREEIRWELELVDGGHRRPLLMPLGTPEATWPWAGREVALSRSAQGRAVLVARDPRPRLIEARWTDDGALELAGELGGARDAREIVVAAGSRSEQYAFPLRVGADGRFSARLTPARTSSLAGALPLRAGTWGLRARTPGDRGLLVPIMLDPALHDELPLTAVADHKPFAFGMTARGRAVLVVQRDLDDDERGRYHQRRLRRTAYAARRSEPLRDAVVYSSFNGRQYSDNPRAIHEELVRRGAALEHFWVVRDGACRVPETATVLREGSREYHEALATARFVVTNDHFPDWFARREDQVCLQTWHGTPLKRLGLDVSERWGTIRRFQRRWSQQVANWQYVISPNRFSTPILRRAYRIEGELLETGYPRNDVLAGADRDPRAQALRRRLGVPDGVRTVLYAPTYRDQVVDGRGRYRLDLRLDIDRLRAAVGRDTVILFRKHHYIADAVPATDDGFVRDVSAYPDGTELMLAADVLVTDYSSMIFDFANTGRPMLFFTYDLETYREEIRGFYFDFTATAPGPLLRTSDELAAALADVDAVAAQHAERYREFAFVHE